MARTYNDIYIEARRRLKAAGIEAYSLEARLILATAADKTPEAFYRDIQLYTNDAYEQKAEALIARRLAGEPVAYLTGSWEFFGIPLTVTPDVLIPRIDSEVVVETVVALLAGYARARVLDLCCGSGCIGLAVASQLPNCRVVCVDNSEKALAVARKNAIAAHAGARATCIAADALAEPPIALGTFDLLVCNPPYIPHAELAALDGSVRNYEPLAALDGGEDGLLFYREIPGKWKRLLAPGGFLVFECGIGQSETVRALTEAAGFRHIRTVRDTGGIDRAIAFGLE